MEVCVRTRMKIRPAPTKISFETGFKISCDRCGKNAHLSSALSQKCVARPRWIRKHFSKAQLWGSNIWRFGLSAKKIDAVSLAQKKKLPVVQLLSNSSMVGEIHLQYCMYTVSYQIVYSSGHKTNERSCCFSFSFSLVSFHLQLALLSFIYYLFFICICAWKVSTNMKSSS